MDVDDYWSIDSLCTGEQKLKVSLLHGIKDYGYLNEENKEDLYKDNKIEMPLWLAIDLNACEKLDIATPKYFSTSFRNTIIADPTVINLKNKSEYFYETAFMLGSVMKQENLSIIMPVIRTAFKERLKMILELSDGKNNSQNMTSILKRLCNFEMKLFRANRERSSEVLNFKQQNCVANNYGVEDKVSQLKSYILLPCIFSKVLILF